jgi:hypothetical protein
MNKKDLFALSAGDLSLEADDNEERIQALIERADKLEARIRALETGPAENYPVDQ